MSLFDYANGAIVVLCVVSAAFFPERDRSAALLSACLFAALWVMFEATYYMPLTMLWNVGVMLWPEDLWAMFDGIAGLLILAIGFRTWWGWTLWATYIIQEIMHMMYRQLGIWDYPLYGNALDKVFLIQAAVFLLGGSGGVAEYVGGIYRSSAVRGLHSLRGSQRQARQARVTANGPE